MIPDASTTSSELATGASSSVPALGGQDHLQVPAFSPEIAGGFDESSLAYFLNDIMLPFEPDPHGQCFINDQQNQVRTPRDFLDFGTTWIDFTDLDTMLGMNDLETAPRTNTVSFNPLPPSGTKTPIFGDGMSLGNDAFSRSIWRWTPTKKDYGGADNLNLSLPYSDMESPEARAVAESSLSHQRLDSTLRDKILALVLSTCETIMYRDVASSFPSADLLNNLMHYYLTVHFGQNDSWLHLPTFEASEQWLELIIMVVAAGAAICSVPAIRRLGFALQEAVRTAVARKVRAGWLVSEILA